MDVVKLLTDFSIDHRTEGHKHCRPGWVNVPCPFCTGNPGYHLGWCIQDEYWKCWRCGWHPPVKTIAALLNVQTEQAYHLTQQYDLNRTIVHYKKRAKETFKLPTNIERLNNTARVYLKKRGFDANELKKQWKLKSLGPLSTLENVQYKHRILIPYIWNGKIVTFDSRDVTEKQSSKYQACPVHLEKMERKKMLYGAQEHWGETGICVEGPTDVWRFGVNAFAVSGIEFTHTQVRLIAQIFKRVLIVFDGEPQAQKQARKLRAELKLRNVAAQIVTLPTKNDPGGMQQMEADEFIKRILQ